MKLESSNKFLESAFAWAVDKTAAFVVTGTKNGAINKGEGGNWYGPDGKTIKSPTEPWTEPKDYKPAFWAGYFDRTAYYIRDFVHQVSGAYYVGLEEEIFNMYYTFVSNASEKTGWFAPWAFNFDGSIYYMDTPNYNRFVREITAQFELCEKAYTLYLLTGDRRYAENDVIFNFIEKTMSVFIDNLDGAVLGEKNGIPEGFGDIFEISATYNERGFNAAEAGDSIAAMYQAILSYANILKIRGNTEEAEKQFERAEKLKEYFNNEWSIVKGSDMYAYAIDNKGKKHYKWYKKRSEIHGGETLKFIPLKGITYPGERTEKLLDYIHQCELNPKTREDNIESLTYLPDLFLRHRRSEEAWNWMKHIISQKDLPHEHKSQGTNGDYPEISFTFISQVVEGIMGISVDAVKGEITVCPCLPNEIDDVKIYDLKFGDYSVDVFAKKDRITVKNNSNKKLVWNYVSENKFKIPILSQRAVVSTDKNIFMIEFEKIQKNLEEKGYKVTCFETSKEAADYLNTQISNKTVGFGGSMTLEKMELYESLSSHNNVFWHQKAQQGQNAAEIRLHANRSQIYVSSVNALAETGEIVNIDGNCNRVSAILYGHEKVYLVAGKNKITKDYDSALFRARNIAAPKNAKRFKMKTPCAVNADRCYDCKGPERICRGLSVLWAKPMTGEFEVILINEDLGY